VALPKIGFNEGSLLRRTLLHVAGFIMASTAFIGIVSFILVSVAKGLVSPRAEATTDDDAAPAATARAAANAPGVPAIPAPMRPGPARTGRRPGAMSGAPARSD
jgi:hypothetical protein